MTTINPESRPRAGTNSMTRKEVYEKTLELIQGPGWQWEQGSAEGCVAGAIAQVITGRPGDIYEYKPVGRKPVISFGDNADATTIKFVDEFLGSVLFHFNDGHFPWWFNDYPGQTFENVVRRLEHLIELEG